MTSSKLLIPLRVPELGPYLGKLVIGTGRGVPGIPLEARRIELVTRIMKAVGEARRLAHQEARGAALAAVSSQVWLDAWDEAVGRIGEALVGRIDQRLDDEAVAVRMPRRLRRRLSLDAAERRALAGRLGATGAGLVRALDTLDTAAGHALDATARDRERLEQWHRALTTAARRLEDAWLALEDQVDAEIAQWDGVADRVAAWRRSPWPVIVVGVPLLIAAGWLGLVLGGYVAAPTWLARLWELF